MNKIRLVTVTGSRTDTLEYMLNHYYDLVDEIYVVAYDTNNGQHANVKAITDKFKQKVFLYKHEDDQEYNWETVTAIYNEIKSLYPLSQEVVKGLRQLKNKTFSQSDHYIGRNLSCLIKLSWTEQEVQARALNMANCIKIHCINSC